MNIYLSVVVKIDCNNHNFRTFLFSAFRWVGLANMDLRLLFGLAAFTQHSTLIVMRLLGESGSPATA